VAGASRNGVGAHWVADRDAALRLVRDQANAGDVVLVKASRAVGLEKLAQALLASVPEEQLK